MFFNVVSFARTCFLACAISGGSLDVAATITGTAPVAVAPGEEAAPPAAAFLESKPPDLLVAGRVRLLRLPPRRLPPRRLLEEELLLLDEMDLALFARLFDLLFERLFDRLFDRALAAGFFGGLRLLRAARLRWPRRLFDLLLDLDTLLFRLRERLGDEDDEHLPCEVAASESLNLRRAFLPRHRRSLLPFRTDASFSSETETGSSFPSRSLPRPEPGVQPAN
mmetsp:Transcript_91862/g.295289  ORF Transcript_91862/g.295289 Transcript_91862/m.295289 type:complete len:223 (-) Transcript_91862:1599-2267(-)